MTMFLTEQSPEELHREREELKKTLIRKVTQPAFRIFAVAFRLPVHKVLSKL